MKAYQKVVVVVGCLGMMVAAGGCASKDVVKKDEPINNDATAKAPAAPTATKPQSDLKNSDSKKAGSTAPSDAMGMAAAKHAAKSSISQTAFEKVYFNFDSSDLSASARDALTRDAEILMKEQKDAKVRIEGNCDERGSAEYNLALGERRAKAAAKYLATLGVQQDRLATISYGKEKPAVQGNDEAAWSKNRRDEFVLQK